jgi:hypothetical protein
MVWEIDMTEIYGEQHRSMQNIFDTKNLADRLDEITLIASNDVSLITFMPVLKLLRMRSLFGKFSLTITLEHEQWICSVLALKIPGGGR